MRILLIFLLSFGWLQAEILKVRIEGIIDPITAEFISEAVDRAGREEAEFLLIELSTPGGLGLSMQQIMEKMLNSRVPIVCHVVPKGARAASAGFFILLSADVAVMAPGTNTGSAHPVFPFGTENKTMLEKVTNDALANLRAIVKQRDRNYELAEKGVLESKSYTANEALEGGLIDLIAEDEQDLLRLLEGRRITRFSGERQTLAIQGQGVRLLEMSTRQRLLSSIANPNMALLLGVIGVLGLYLEFTNPGLLLPGIVGGICLLLSMLGFSLLPINLIGVLLIILALGLFIAEVKVQGFGLFGIAGIIAMTLGLLFLIDSPDPSVRISLGMALAVTVSFGIIIIFLLRLAIRAQLSRVTTGSEGLVGLVGKAKTAVSAEGGKVFVAGEWWDAVSERVLPAGARVRILRADNLLLTVEPLDEGGPGADDQTQGG